jgi:formate hydrogenlyase subunit 3/multisubunit Na+/H+ antiporter MnhD subunit
MPLATLLLPPLVLVLAAAAAWGLERAGVDVGRPIAAGAAWAALAALTAGWFAGGRTPLDQSTPLSAAGVPLVLRMDAVTVLFWLAVLLPVALLLTFQRRTSGQAAVSALAAAAALGALAAGSLVLTAFGLAVCAGLVLVLLCRDELRATWAVWLSLTGAWLLLTWTAVLLERAGGTSVYGAVPVTALAVPSLALLAAAAVLCSGLQPWRTWVSDVWTRQRLASGSLAVAMLVPIGFLPLVRAYGMGGGQLPSAPLGLALAALGTATSAGAAIRAQAASSRRGVLAEAVPFGAGMALLALGLGSPLGVVAALAGIAGLGVAAGLAPLAADDRGPLVSLATAILAGMPPALVFGGWLLSLQAALEMGGLAGFLGLGAAGAWLLALAAAARAPRLPVAPPDAEEAPSPAGAAAGVAVALAGGVVLTALLALVAIPAAAEVMPPAGRAAQAPVSAAAVLTGSTLAVSTASGGWAAALLGGPLVALAAAGTVAWLLAARRRVIPVPAARGTGGEPLFAPPLGGVPERAAAWPGTFQIPEQYRSLFQPAVVERAITSGRPWLWVVITVALAVLVTR